MFQDDIQRGRVCKVLTEQIRGGPWWAPREDVGDAVPRPSDAALAWADNGAEHGSTWERALLGWAWTFWNPRPEPRMAPFCGLDSVNTLMVGELIVAYATSTHAVQRWIARWEGRP